MQDKESILSRTRMHVQGLFQGESSGHDWWHIARVTNMALAIGGEENADLYVVELAALLHDVADWKFYGGDEDAGPNAAGRWLEGQGAGSDIIAHVCEIIRDLSFKGTGTPTRMATLEGMVVQDADRLDAIGAIGIARAFAYGGSKGREMHNPSVKPEKHDSFETYKRGNGPTLNHFYEKLLLLKDRMNTATALRIAKERHIYMEQFLDRFYQEWDGQV